MATDDSHAGPVGAPGFQIPRLLRAAEVLVADGRVLRGRVFLPATAASHAGAMRAEEWMNEPQPFFPFLPDGEGRPVILNKDQLVLLTVPGAGAADDPRADSAAPRRHVLVECGPLQVSGEVIIDMPADHLRVLDLLNRPGRFLEVREGERRHFVRKARVTRVTERPSPATPA